MKVVEVSELWLSNLNSRNHSYLQVARAEEGEQPVSHCPAGLTGSWAQQASVNTEEIAGVVLPMSPVCLPGA